MNKTEVCKIFLDILETTPGVFSIQCADNKGQCENCVMISEHNSVWDFMATITILKNSNCKSIITSINSLLRFKLKQSNQKLGKLNIFIGGINND